jgi:hypothetical protein
MDEFRALAEFAVQQDVSFAFCEYELGSQDLSGGLFEDNQMMAKSSMNTPTPESLF